MKGLLYTAFANAKCASPTAAAYVNHHLFPRLFSWMAAHCHSHSRRWLGSFALCIYGWDRWLVTIQITSRCSMVTWLYDASATDSTPCG